LQGVSEEAEPRKGWENPQVILELETRKVSLTTYVNSEEVGGLGHGRLRAEQRKKLSTAGKV